MLPYEILELVFSYLPPKDLDVIPQVCRFWHDVASDKIWRHHFEADYDTSDITPVISPFVSWRQEVLNRRLVLQKWRKAAKSSDKTISSTLRDATHVFPNFASDEASTFCFNSWVGHGVTVDLERGKVRRRVYASKYRHETLPVSLVEGSRFGMVYGYFDGTLSASVASRDGVSSMDYYDLSYRHPSAVSAIWIAQTRGFWKSTGSAVSVASGSQDGTIYLTSGRGETQIQLRNARVMQLQGAMYGAHTSNDGDSVVVLYADGYLYRLTPASTIVEEVANLVEGTAAPETEDAGNLPTPGQQPGVRNPSSSDDGRYDIQFLGVIPLDLDMLDHTLQLTQCNDCVLVRTRRGITVYDFETTQSIQLEIPHSASITAFAIDKSFTPGTKSIVAGLSSNEICMWTIPPSSSNEPMVRETKIVLVNAKHQPKIRSKERNFLKFDDIEAGNGPVLDHARFNVSGAPRSIIARAKWVQPNPIGYEARLEESEKPQITKLALNSAIVLVGGYNGRAFAVDVLTGHPLKRIDSRISKTMLDIARYSRDGFVPVTHLEVDPDPARPRGIIAVRPALQFFDLGRIGSSQRNGMAARTKRGSKRRTARDVNLDNDELIRDLRESMELNDEFALMDAEADERDTSLREQFGMDQLGEDEQLEYALMLSQQSGEGDGGEEEEMDEELRQALELSRLEDAVHRSEAHAQADISTVVDATSADDINIEDYGSGGFDENEDEDEELRRVLAQSLHET